MLRHVKAFDAFSKTLEDVRVKTATGGIVSIVSLSVISVLVVSELAAFLRVDRVNNLAVDASREETLQVFLNMDFPRANCEVLGINLEDSTGTRQLDISSNVFKTRLDVHGKKIRHEPIAAEVVKKKSPVSRKVRCGSCYEASGPGLCCNSCDDVRKAFQNKNMTFPDVSKIAQCNGQDGEREDDDAAIEVLQQKVASLYRPNEGCNIQGQLNVPRVRGRLEILVGHSMDFGGFLIHDVSVLREHRIDLSHKIHYLSFGAHYPGQSNPLDGVEKKAVQVGEEMGKHEYFVKVVPTTYRGRWKRTLSTNQFSVTEYFRPSDPTKGGTSAPGLYIEYDFSPIRVEYTESVR